jgi:hypothetical protein
MTLSLSQKSKPSNTKNAILPPMSLRGVKIPRLSLRATKGGEAISIHSWNRLRNLTLKTLGERFTPMLAQRVWVKYRVRWTV